MRAFVTGATGFLGGRLAELLRARGDEVVALVRSRARTARLERLGCELVEGELSDAGRLGAALAGCDAAFHSAADYRIGIRPSERPAMFEANVRGTERVLDAALAAAVPRVVYVSTVNVFGNTRGRVVDETYRRSPGDYLSYYDETKYLAHRAAVERAGRGAPVVIAQPGVIYGPGDHALAGGQLLAAYRGTLRYVTFPEGGFNAGHVDDIAAGLLLVHDRGTPGESYVLGGEVTTMRGALEVAAGLGGRRVPRLVMPAAGVAALIPVGPLLPRFGLPANPREILTAGRGVTYWATDAKARRELGYAARGLEDGLRDWFAAL